jgi:tRNA threonylcarbamoyladenosine biosynthesis protein TsaE
MMTILTIRNLNTIRFAAKQFVSLLNQNSQKVYCFNGEMGAGKTTFIKAICEELGVTETVNSPTFSIINEYRDKNDDVIYHFDCYRIEKVQDALNLGAEEYLYSGNYCFLEWAEKIELILPKDRVDVFIEEVEEGIRMVTIDS